MNYRHAYHAGNFADVIKHIALVALIRHLQKKEKGFAVIDAQAGRGLYDLAAPEAAKTGEAQAGIGRLHPSADDPALLAAYLEIVRSAGPGRYPGSPLIAARLLRPQDRLVAIEKHPEEFAQLKRALAPYARARAVEGDGYAQLKALLPPPERRGLVLVDPPYERDDEFVEAARALVAAHRRFATGICLWWYPLKSAAAADAAIGELINAGMAKLCAVTFDTGARAADRLAAAGLVAVNAPFGFDSEMRGALAQIAPRLAPARNASWRVEWLAGENR